mgnify:CR=1 FL=1
MASSLPQHACQIKVGEERKLKSGERRQILKYSEESLIVFMHNFMRQVVVDGKVRS